MDEPTRARDKVVSLEFGSRQPSVRIHLLGALRATSYLGENLLPRGKKARAMLGYLCLHAGQRVLRSRIAALLWDRVPDQQARTNLRQALRELTLALGPLAEELLSADAETVRLEARSCWIDAVAVLSSGLDSGDALRGDLAALCTGDLLEDVSGVTRVFDQWLLGERTRFSAQLTQLLEGELHHLATSGAAAERQVAVARRVIAFDPTHEGASRSLMRALADLGERAQALREYERCRAAVRTALDVEPSPETRALYQAIKSFSGPAKAEGTAVAAVSIELPDGGARTAPSSRRLRVGVLPFQAHSPHAQGLAFSLPQEIAAALARFRWFDVIAPVAVASRSPKRAQMLRQTPCDYVVDGTLLGSDSNLQVSVHLLDASQDGRVVWSDRFELTSEALDEVNDRVVAPVVARIDPIILFIEGQPRRSQRSGATGLVLQAVPLMYSMERGKYEEAGRLIERALEIDPENAKAAAWAAYWHVWHTGQGWARDPEASFERAQELALRAIRIDPDNAEALGLYAHICAFLDKDFDSAVFYFERALRLNPNLAVIWAMSAATYCYIGQPERALQHLDRYRDLAPFDPHFQYWELSYAIAYTFKGDYEKAVAIARRAIKATPEFSNGYKPLIASLGHLGRRDEAAPYIRKLLSLEPSFTVARFGQTYPFQRDEDRQRYMRGLERAGVPPG